MGERILCVDDETDLLETLAEFLQTHGYQVSTANSGRMALEMLETEPMFDLILCDIAMPEMDGLMLLRLLRAKKHFAAVPFIFMTALSHKEDLMKAHRLGCDEYLVKPVDFDVLEVLVASRIARERSVSRFYNEPQIAFQQLMLQALTEEMMEPTNAIVSSSSFISQMLEGGDELLERRFNQVYQNAAQQLNMLQQLSLMLRHQATPEGQLADYVCQTGEIMTHIQRLLRVYHLQDKVNMHDISSLPLQCDPFLISKAVASLLIREFDCESADKLNMSLREDTASGQVCMMITRAEKDARQMSCHLIESHSDCAAFKRELCGKIISVLFLFDIVRMHQASLSLMVQGDEVCGYLIQFPQRRSVKTKAAI